MKKFLKRISDHLRLKNPYYVCGLITICLIALGIFKFPNAIGRLVEGARDLFNSLAYYVCELLGIEHSIVPTVNILPDYSFLNIREWISSWFERAPSTPSPPSDIGPSIPTPDGFESFKSNWTIFWELFWDSKNFLTFLYYAVYWISLIFSIGMILVVIVIGGKKFFEKVYFKEQKPAKGETLATIYDSAPLRAVRWMLYKWYYPVYSWARHLIAFIQEHEALWQFWLILFLLYFNAFTIVLELCAYYVYFAISFDFINLYKQVYKLFLDLRAFFGFMPVFFYVILALILLDKLAKKKGYDRLEHNERKNRGFINSLGTVTYIYSEMGAGKTSMLTDMSLSMEVQLRDDALEIILECDVLFPNFPWLKFERELRSAYAKHDIYDKWSCVRWMRARQAVFEQDPCSENIFGYDIDHYPMEFDHKSHIEYIWETLLDYALAYTIYTVESSLIVSNYSIRVDGLMNDLGNFPIWNSDFFHRDSRMMDAFSRHSHILDFDMIRLGNQILEKNPNRYAFGWGVWVITEADKEFKNTLELQEVKGMVDECNQKNDLTHVLMKMARHACYIRHRNMVRIAADMQRIENITANLRGIGQVALIAESSEDYVVLPFYSSYKLFSPLLLPLKSKFDSMYVNNRFLRADNRLLTNGVEYLRSKIGQWNDRTYSVFGAKSLSIELQSGRMEGNVKITKYNLSFMKGRSKRNGSDCMAGTFESRGACNLIGLNDMAEYADYIATQDELYLQNSYTQKELKKYGGDVDMKKERETDIKAVDKLLSSTVEGLMAIQNGKIKVSEETSRAAQTLVRELCSVVSEWAKEDDAENVVRGGD